MCVDCFELFHTEADLIGMKDQLCKRFIKEAKESGFCKNVTDLFDDKTFQRKKKV